MKKHHLLWLVFAVIILESCARSMTPYEAAHTSRKSRKCATIR